MSRTPKMDALLASLTASERDLVLRHIDAETPAQQLAQTLRANGHEIGPTSIKKYRAERRSREPRAGSPSSPAGQVPHPPIEG